MTGLIIGMVICVIAVFIFEKYDWLQIISIIVFFILGFNCCTKIIEDNKPKIPDINPTYKIDFDKMETNSSTHSGSTSSMSSESSGASYSYPSYSYPTDYNSAPVMQERTPRRDPCRSCHNTGTCRVCNGYGQTRTRRVYNYNLNCYDLDWEQCKHCYGSGRCPACKGDGYLDEGIDF